MSSQEHSGPSTRGPPRRRPHGGCLGPLSSLGAPVARRAQRQAWLARCKHLSVRRHAANVQRRLAGLRAAGLAAARVAMSAHTARWRRVLLSSAAGVCAAACAGRRKRRLLQAGRPAARARLADGRGGRGRGGGGCRWTSRRRTAGSAAPPAARCSHCSTSPPRGRFGTHGWLQLRRSVRAAGAGDWRRPGGGAVGVSGDLAARCPFQQRRRRRRRRCWWRRGNGGGQDAPNDRF